MQKLKYFGWPVKTETIQQSIRHAAGLKIVRCEAPIGTANFTKQQLRLVKPVAQKP